MAELDKAEGKTEAREYQGRKRSREGSGEPWLVNSNENANRV